MQNVTRNIKALSKQDSGSIGASPDVRIRSGLMTPTTKNNLKAKLVRTETRSVVDSEMLDDRVSTLSKKSR